MMEDKLIIRKAGIDDAAFISLLGRVTFTETFGHLFRDEQDLKDYYERTFSVDKIEKSLGKSRNIFWLALVDRLPVGYAKLKLESKTEFIQSDSTCQLQKIYVLRDFHSMCIGSELQQSLLVQAKALEYEHIWLSALNSNVQALDFYKRNEFIEIGAHGFQIGKEKFELTAMSKKALII